MKDIIRLLAKEVRRLRALIELMEEWGGYPYRIRHRKTELDILKRIIAIAIKKSLTFH